jgi:6-phosphogluconolactonase
VNLFIHTSKTSDDLANAFAKQLVNWVKESAGKPFHMALSGGKTPSLLFSILAEKYNDTALWKDVHFWWGDERMVPPKDAESNFGVVNNLLFEKIGINQDHIHRIKGESEVEKETVNYGIEIKRNIPDSNGWPTFDLIILGLGDDGHTASIFPGKRQLLQSDLITAIALHPQTGQQRITLTGKVLNNAKKVAFLVSGSSKSRIFNEIIHDSPAASRYPANYIRPEKDLHWFVDDACVG